MAKWSEVWSNEHIPVRHRTMYVTGLRLTPPAKAKKRKGGEYPHLQPFFRNRPKKEDVRQAKLDQAIAA